MSSTPTTLHELDAFARRHNIIDYWYCPQCDERVTVFNVYQDGRGNYWHYLPDATHHPVERRFHEWYKELLSNSREIPTQSEG